jgi:hypothetical protein
LGVNLLHTTESEPLNVYVPKRKWYSRTTKVPTTCAAVVSAQMVITETPISAQKSSIHGKKKLNT